MLIFILNLPSLLSYYCDLWPVPLAALPTSITQPLGDITVTEHQSLTLECHVSHPNKTPKWFFEGQEVTASARIQLNSEGKVHKLTIGDALLDDEGVYKIEIDGVSCESTVLVDG